MGRREPVQTWETGCSPAKAGAQRRGGTTGPRPSPGTNASAANAVLEDLAGLELGLGRFLDLHRLPGARVASGRGLPLGAGEGAEADQPDLVAALQGGGDGVENPLD